MADPILPSASSFLTAAIDAIVADRPEALAHFNNPASNWNNLPAVWRAQILLNLRYLASSVRAARLRTATGAELRALCASEFQTQLPATPQTATGQVTLARPTVTAGQGIIPAGTPFSKLANPLAVPLPIAAASYTVTDAVYVSPTTLSVVVNLTATSSGSAANLPSFVSYNNVGLIVPAKPLFDPTLVPVVDVLAPTAAAGGSDGLPDAVLVAAAKAYAVGQYGPTMGALVAGLLAQQSVRNFAVFPACDAVPYAQAYFSDQSWAQSLPWGGAVQKIVAGAWKGFGCRIRYGGILNQQITVSPTIILNSVDDLNDTTDIDTNVRATAEAYFNSRPDWYVWRRSTLQGLLSSCDARIRKCSGVLVNDFVSGLPVPEPTYTFGTSWLPTLTHLYLTNQACQSTYVPPN
jgi:hypothetical protein